MNKDNRLFGKSKRKFLPKSADKFLAEEIPQPRKGEGAILFLAALLINLIFAYLFKYVWTLGSNDAIQQTSKAIYLLYSQGSPLASINLIHPPILIILQVVPVPVLRQVNAAAFSAPFLSSLFGAAVLLILNRILLLLRVHDRYRWVLLLLTQFFPSLLFAAAVGAADMAHVFMVLIVLWGCMLINRKEMAFLICGLGITLGFFVQYQIVSLIFGVILASIILKWNMHEKWKEELEGWLLAFMTPALYALGLWLLLNWLNQNDPLYFLKTILDPIHAPSIARHAGAIHPFFLGWDNVIESFAIAGVNIWETSYLFFIGIAMTIFYAFFFNRRRYIANLMIILGVPATLALMIFLGILPPWQYVWTSLIPLSVILACQPYQDLKPNAQNWMMVGILILIFGSIGINFQSLSNPKRSQSEQRFHAIIMGEQTREIGLRESDPYWVFQHDAPIVANALDKLSSEGKILVDGTIAAPVLIQSEHLHRLIVVKDISIPTIYSQDAREAEFVLIVKMVEPLNPSTLPFAMPELSSDEIPWATQVWESDQTILDWRIFRLALEKAE